MKRFYPEYSTSQSFSPKSQHDLSGMFAPLEHPVRFSDLREFTNLVNDDLDLTGFQLWPNAFAELRGDAGLLFNRSGAQCRSSNGQPVKHDRHKIEIWHLAPLKKGDLKQSPFELQQADILLDVRSAHHVEHNVDAPPASHLL